MSITNTYTVKISVKEAKKNVDDINMSLQQQEDLLKDIQREIEKIEDKRAKADPKDRNRIKQYNEKLKEAATLQKRTKLRVQETKQEQSKANKVLKEAEKNQADFAGVLGLVDKQTGGAISSMKGFTKSIKGATKGFKLMKIAWMATGLGALVVLITSITGAFTRSEEGQEKWARGMAMIGAVVNQVLDVLADLGTAIINVFTNPGKALEDFGKKIKTMVTDKISALLDGLGLLGGAIKKAFSGDFSGAMEDAGKGLKTLNNNFNLVKITTDAVIKGTKNLAKATSDLITETGKEIDVMNKVTKARQKAHHIERDLIVERAKANREINDIRLEAEKRDEYTTSQRIELLKKAQQIEEEITQKQINAKQLLVDAMILEQSISLNTIEDKDKLAKLQAELINLDTKKLRSQRLLQTQITTATNEEKAALKSVEDLKKKIREATARGDEELRQLELNKINEHFQKLIEQAEANNLVTDELKTARDLALKDKEQEFELQKATELQDLKNQIRDAVAITEDEQRELEIIKITEHYNKLIELAKAQGLSVVDLEKAKVDALNNFGKEASDNAINWEELTEGEKMKIISDGFNNLATILGEETAAGKAAAIAAATISTFQSAQSSYASLAPIPIIGPALGAAAAGAAIVSGMAQVKAITATKVPTLGGKAAPSVSGGSVQAPAPPTPPSFNIVGASETNQLADIIGDQQQQPVQAFVVASEVTSAQALERNTIEGATIG